MPVGDVTPVKAAAPDDLREIGARCTACASPLARRALADWLRAMSESHF